MMGKKAWMKQVTKGTFKKKGMMNMKGMMEPDADDKKKKK